VLEPLDCSLQELLKMSSTETCRAITSAEPLCMGGIVSVCLVSHPHGYISSTCSNRYTRLPHQDSDVLGSLKA